MEEVNVSFDSEYKIRVFDEVKSRRASQLEAECSIFSEKINDFGSKVDSLIDLLETHASRIDVQKLRAIGLRMACESESENRVRQKRTQQAITSEKRNELDRYNGQYQSLQRIESEQKAALEKITST